MKKSIILIYGIIVYNMFFVTFLYMIGFVGGFDLVIGDINLIPKHINTPGEANLAYAIVMNVLLLSIFAVQHSVMARPAFKKWWTTIIPQAAERSTYVLATSLVLILLFWQWQPINGVVWHAENEIVRYSIIGLFALGCLVVLLSTFMINHFHLFGLTQVFNNFKQKQVANLEFKNHYFYKLVRHPIMTGFIMVMWATPTMTAGHFLFTVVASLYILIAVKFLEEKDLQNELGDVYTDYKKKVPMLIPFTKISK